MRGSADSALRVGPVMMRIVFLSPLSATKKNRSVETERFLRHEG
jgi:hypothetical protein